MGEEHRIEQLLQEILQRLTKIETYNATNHDRIKELEDNQKWLWRTVVSLVAGAVIAYFTRT